MKKSNKRLIFIMVILLLIIGCTPQNQVPPNQANPDPVEEPPIDDPIVEVDEIQEQLDKMSLEEKVGQLLLVGFEGTDLNDDTISYIDDLGVGGLVFFARNIESKEQVSSLVEDINDISNIPLFLSIDEEGGIVSRMPQEYKKLPDSIKIGNTRDTDLAFDYGHLLGNRVRSLGLNLNFAPVMDIHSNPSNPVIGKRSFASTAEIVSEMGINVAKGIRKANVIPSIKHFPGHGDTSTDSHIELPIINKSLDDIREFELIPFKEAIEEDIEMIMSAHILIPSIDEEYPATLSHKILGNLLRDELGYEGVIISDDMTMGAIVNNYTLEEASIDFLKAGGDIVLICHGADNPRLVFDEIMDSIENMELSLEDIDNKVYRILKLKDRYLNEENKELDLEDLNNKAEVIINKIK